MGKQSNRKSYSSGGGGSANKGYGGGSYGNKPKKGGGRLAPKSENKIFAIVMASIIVLGVASFFFFKTIYPVITGAKTPATAATVNGQKMPGWLFDYYENEVCLNDVSYYLTLLGLPNGNYTKAEIINFLGSDLYASWFGAYVEETAFSSLVSAAFTFQAAKDLGLSADKKELKKELADSKAEWKKKNSASDKEFKAMLKSNGLTEKRLLYIWELGDLRAQIVAYFSDLTKIPDEEADKEAETAFAETPKRWLDRKSSHILIMLDPAKWADWDDEDKDENLDEDGEDERTDEEKAYDRAMKIIELLNKDPERFAELAEKYSEDTGSNENGGFYDFFISEKGTTPDGTFDPAYAKALFALENVGDYTLEPVEGIYGYHIIKLEEISDKTFEDLRETIIEDLNYDLLAEAYNGYMGDLLDKADIKRKMKFRYWEDGNKEY